jgi:glutaminyl-tRNA synthetase
MPTIVGMRRRGYTPESIQLFCERIGVSRSDGWIDYALLEQALRDDLDPRAARTVVVLDPVKLVISNWPAGHSEPCTAPVNPHQADAGRREFPLTGEVWVERDDYQQTPTKGFFRLTPGGLVRLKYGYVVRCSGARFDADGTLTEIHAEYLPETRSGTPGADSIKVKGNITWISTAAAVPAEVRLYDRLFLDPQPDAAGKDFLSALNPHSRSIRQGFVEPGTDATAGRRYQFERHGYFIADAIASTADQPVFNRIATLRDTWGK